MSGKTILSILFVCILPIVLGLNDAEQKIQNAIDSCAVEHGHSSDKHAGFVKRLYKDKLEYCIAACAMEKLGTLSNGVFTGKDSLEFLEKQTQAPASHGTQEVIKKCVKEYGNGGKDHYKTVDNLHDCLFAGLEKVFGSPDSLDSAINQILLYIPGTFK